MVLWRDPQRQLVGSAPRAWLSFTKSKRLQSSKRVQFQSPATIDQQQQCIRSRGRRQGSLAQELPRSSLDVRARAGRSKVTEAATVVHDREHNSTYSSSSSSSLHGHRRWGSAKWGRQRARAKKPPDSPAGENKKSFLSTVKKRKIQLYDSCCSPYPFSRKLEWVGGLASNGG